MTDQATDTNTDTDTNSAEVEAQAREIGWTPESDYKGDPAKFVDAKTYLERGQHVLPIVKATNRRLRADLDKTSAELASMREALRQSQETIKAIEEYHTEDVKQKVESARAKLLSELKAAKSDGNVDREVELTDELTRLNKAETDDAATRKVNGKPVTVDDPTKDPEYQRFVQEAKDWDKDNEWIVNDPAIYALAQGVTMRLRSEGNRERGRVFLDKVAEETRKELTKLRGGTRPPGDKAEASRGGGNSRPTQKGYNNLPAEAKEACDRFIPKLVGEGRRYKTVEEWRAHYAKRHFEEV